jgi:hypothetical protein
MERPGGTALVFRLQDLATLHQGLPPSIWRRVRIPAIVTAESGDRDRLARSSFA